MYVVVGGGGWLVRSIFVRYSGSRELVVHWTAKRQQRLLASPVRLEFQLSSPANAARTQNRETPLNVHTLQCVTILL